MATQHYFGYSVHGVAVSLDDQCFEAFGFVERDGKLWERSPAIGVHRTRERAEAEGLAWGKVWVDMRVQGFTDVRREARASAPSNAEG